MRLRPLDLNLFLFFSLDSIGIAGFGHDFHALDGKDCRCRSF